MYQEPYYPQIPPPPPLPPKKKSIWPILAAIAGVLIIGLVLTVITLQIFQSIPTRQSSSTTTSVWQITINSTKTNAGDASNTPNPGDIYLLIDFTAKNTDTYAHDMSYSLFTLQSEQGNTYNRAYINVPNNPDGPVASGQQLQGDLSYEVPKALHAFTLQFNSPDDPNTSQPIQWIITV